MAFTLQTWARSSTGANEPLNSATPSGCFRVFSYYTADTPLVYDASAYFDSVAYDITTGDYVDVYSSDSSRTERLRLTNTAGVITSAMVGGKVYGYAEPTLAEFIAMSTTPIQLIPAPGAGRLLVLDDAAIRITQGTTTLAAGAAVHVQWGNTTAGLGVKASAVVAAAVFTGWTNTTPGFCTVEPVVLVESPNSTSVDLGLFLSCITQDFTGGLASTYTISASASVHKVL